MAFFFLEDYAKCATFFRHKRDRNNIGSFQYIKYTLDSEINLGPTFIIFLFFPGPMIIKFSISELIRIKEIFAVEIGLVDLPRSGGPLDPGSDSPDN